MYSPKVLLIPRNRWLRLNMTENLFTGTLNKNQNKKIICCWSWSAILIGETLLFVIFLQFTLDILFVKQDSLFLDINKISNMIHKLSNILY